MNPGDRAKRLRIYLSSTDKYDHRQLYEVIVYEARKAGIAGATVLKGIMGFGASSEVSTTKLWEITEKMPLVVEIIDEAHKLDSFYEYISTYLDKAGKGHIITIEETTIVIHKAGTLKKNS
jgi:PII-like signaling protein